jgi:outer membrane translocation and assembly module TamA
MFFMLSNDISPKFAGSDITYNLLESRFSLIYSPVSWFTWMFKTKAVAITKLDKNNIPIFIRLFSGGARSVKGYPYQKLGPLDSNGKPTGGLTLFEGGVEGRFPIWRKLQGVVFSDFGQLSQSAWTVDFSEILYTIGLGLRYNTLVGPIRVDLGYQLNPPAEADFDRLQLHISIGMTF